MHEAGSRRGFSSSLITYSFIAKRLLFFKIAGYNKKQNQNWDWKGGGCGVMNLVFRIIIVFIEE